MNKELKAFISPCVWIALGVYIMYQGWMFLGIGVLFCGVMLLPEENNDD